MHAFCFILRYATDCVHMHVCILHSYEICSPTTKCILHTLACSWSLVVIPQLKLGKVSVFFDVCPIDHHYYCSLWVPMEMRPAAMVLGD